MAEEIVMRIIESVVGEDPQRIVTSLKRKSPMENENLEYQKVKKQKLENLQEDLATTTPAPVRSFLNKLKFKVRQQYKTNPPSPSPKKSENEIFM